jgi:hypothetical protein
VSLIRIKCEGVGHLEALERVVEVVEYGLVSESSGRRHYCWATTFHDDIVVVVTRKRRENAADSFTVYRRMP